MQTNSVSTIDAEHATFMQGGVSMNVATCDRDNVPSQVRATGCLVSADRRRVMIFVSATQASAVLANIRNTGMIAVVFNEPSTHRTVQIKGNDARVVGMPEGALRVVEAYRDAFVRELEPLGFEPALIRALLACPLPDIVALAFTPAAAFSQTPGPTAGEPLRTSP